MKARIAVIVMAALLLFYLVVMASRAVLFVTSGEAIGVVIGIALIVLPIIGVWALSREVMFGFRSERLMKLLEEQNELPLLDLPRRPSGRVIRADADAAFPEFRDAAEATPERWQAWARLGLAYDAAGDRKRARGAIRTAITLERPAK
ncbi:hypothetical protein D6T64_14810 [Cryobacterium melibiosiphilum]|uniref:Tetratricopeptide repeat protein n=1 Tax=Cryobacterium melibiosiphilum TaxID=995039 RepID=A0A3A5MHA9_9MICO|nr:hypothetical protein [Cryobacterium melibiosiphilum]RJT87309.1 hypothetical protein D6T64_14810 [Cryobacterium melibiosiphilum]